MTISAAYVCSFGVPTANYPDGDCGMPDWAATLGAAGSTFDRYIVETTDGYELTMVRVTNLYTATIMPSDFGTNGPVLLHHGLKKDGLAWLDRDAADPTPSAGYFLP